MICVSVPICILVTITFVRLYILNQSSFSINNLLLFQKVPETPIWLMSKNRPEKAMKSLQWLRGCVSPEMVTEEYHSLREYSSKVESCEKCSNLSTKCNHSDTLKDKLKLFCTKRIIKPLILMMALQFFLQFCAVNSTRSYIIQILSAYKIQWNVNFAAVALSSFGFVGRLALLPILKAFGKRKIYLVSSVATCLCCFLLSKFHFFVSILSKIQINLLFKVQSDLVSFHRVGHLLKTPRMSLKLGIYQYLQNISTLIVMCRSD